MVGIILTQEELKSYDITRQTRRMMRSTQSSVFCPCQRSARSLAGSATPPNRSNLWTTRSGPATAMVVDDDNSSDEESSVVVPKTASQPTPIPRSERHGLQPYGSNGMLNQGPEHKINAGVAAYNDMGQQALYNYAHY